MTADSSEERSVVKEWPRLAEMDRNDQVSELIAELSNPREEVGGSGITFSVRQRAIVLLGKRGEPGAAAPIAQLLDDAAPEVRSLAAWALGKIGEVSSTEPLLGALEDPDLDVRRNAAAALGRVGAADAVPRLIEALEDDDPWTRMAAARALAQVGDREALRPLRAAARAEGPWHPTFRLRMTWAYLRLWLSGRRTLD